MPPRGGLSVVGIDCRIGPQITEADPYRDAMDRVLDLVETIGAAGVPIAHIDVGGALGIDYRGDTPPTADTLWQRLLQKLDARGFGERKSQRAPTAWAWPATTTPAAELPNCW